ncbi:golgin [Anaeramoeba ignava]|uniref:Golgin n=1 Tax=Anaeramoeba ignava TaxID=1746090 RepID=A0A9Q0LGY4_ANAIG|nr:golgin [Anaeramoeba ignava]
MNQNLFQESKKLNFKVNFVITSLQEFKPLSSIIISLRKNSNKFQTKEINIDSNGKAILKQKFSFPLSNIKNNDFSNQIFKFETYFKIPQIQNDYKKITFVNFDLSKFNPNELFEQKKISLNLINLKEKKEKGEQITFLLKLELDQNNQNSNFYKEENKFNQKKIPKKNLEQEILDQKVQISIEKKKNQKLMNQIRNYVSKYSIKKDKMDQMKKEFESKNEEMKKNNESLLQKINESKKMQNELMENKREMAKMESQIENLKIQNSSLDKSQKELKKENEELSESIKKYQQDQQNIKELHSIQMEKLKSETDLKQDELNQKKNHLDKLLESKNQEFGLLQKELEKKTEENIIQNKILISLKNYIRKLNNIQKENWIIKRCFFVSEQIYSNGIPVSASLVTQFFCNNGYLDGNNSNEPISRVLIESFEMLLKKFEKKNTNKIYWLLSNTIYFKHLFHKIFLSKTRQQQNPNEEYSNFLQHSFLPKNNNQNEKILKLISEIDRLFSVIYNLIIEKIRKRISTMILKILSQKSSKSNNPIRKLPDESYYNPQILVNYFDQLNQIFQKNSFPLDLINSIFSQIIYFIRSIILNSFLNNKSICRYGFAMDFKLTLSALFDWFESSSFSNLKENLDSIKEIIDCVLANKLLLMDTLSFSSCFSVCKSLNLFQVHKLLTNYGIDEFDQEKIFPKDLELFYNQAIIYYSKKDLIHNFDPKKLELDESFIFQIENNFKQIQIDKWEEIEIPKAIQDREKTINIIKNEKENEFDSFCLLFEKTD